MFTNAFIYPAVVKTLIRLKRLIFNCKLEFKLAWVHITLLKTTADSTIFLVLLRSNPPSPLIPHVSLYRLIFPLSFHSLLENAKPQQTKGSYRIIREKCFHSFYSWHMVKYSRTHTHILQTVEKSKQNQTRLNRTKSVQIIYFMMVWMWENDLLYGGVVA